MYCYFCPNDENYNYFTDDSCNYYICYKCWNKVPNYILDYEQKWKLIQLRGDKISETL